MSALCAADGIQMDTQKTIVNNNTSIKLNLPVRKIDFTLHGKQFIIRDIKIKVQNATNCKTIKQKQLVKL